MALLHCLLAVSFFLKLQVIVSAKFFFFQPCIKLNKVLTSNWIIKNFQASVQVVINLAVPTGYTMMNKR
jgi:hypothetical protein